MYFCEADENQEAICEQKNLIPHHTSYLFVGIKQFKKRTVDMAAFPEKKLFY